MIYEIKATIDEACSQAKEMLGEDNISVETLSASSETYDVRVNLINFEPTRLESPKYISFSGDNHAGYFIDIDSVTYEYEDNVDDFKQHANVFLRAIRDGRLSIVRRKLLGIIPLKKNVKLD